MIKKNYNITAESFILLRQRQIKWSATMKTDHSIHAQLLYLALPIRSFSTVLISFRCCCFFLFFLHRIIRIFLCLPFISSCILSLHDIFFFYNSVVFRVHSSPFVWSYGSACCTIFNCEFQHSLMIHFFLLTVFISFL